MSLPKVSVKLHRLVLYLKHTRLGFTAGDLDRLGLRAVMKEHLGIILDFPRHELAILEEEVRALLDKEEVREAIRLQRRRHPEDFGMLPRLPNSGYYTGPAGGRVRTPGTMIRKHPPFSGYGRR